MARDGYLQMRREMERSPLRPVLQQLDLPENFKAYILAMATMAASNPNRGRR
ncbi:hypothetical protein U7230_15065 [Carboxydochorda subterranea]|uniref:Uncharacterized protein n=1 Tax=Carboxydichorda subterranea TaxID=3109565 RepID=A0ABZ1BX46_9FIRM|nr:hypothetical protein [Limnochorda sp. L945t]WRP17380.1 hypothetical protein U7230_15065 [Limnochorda sp. L945t]